MSNYPPYINIHTHRELDDSLSITTIGTHPFEAEKGLNWDVSSIDDSIDAIGEIGLDFAKKIDRELQEQLFRSQLDIAQRLSLAVVIHSVKSLDYTLNILGQYTLPCVIIHGFIGSVQQALAATSRGYYLSFGHRCFASPKTLEALGQITSDLLFLETDESDISIAEIYRRAAEYRTESLEELRAEIYKNYLKVTKQRQ